jgi:4-hydroxythreonine-4-phosphate dehydrogenase
LSNTIDPDKPTVAITCGDPNGIGPEIVLKSLSSAEIRNVCSPVIIGVAGVLRFYHKKLAIDLDLIEVHTESIGNPQNGIALLPVKFTGTDQQFGLATKEGGLAAKDQLEQAVDLALSRRVDALVTAPVSKEALHLAGYGFPGHTEYLAHSCRVDDVVMLFVHENLRIGLATIHCPLTQVSQILSKELLLGKLRIMNEDLEKRFRIKAPAIGVTALNPHASEGGMFGHEEAEIIDPAVSAARAEGISVHGPYPADTLFSSLSHKHFDAFLAMYHDQGLIPVKMASDGCAVNYTAGLPIIRTSPDHGTAFDIAGRCSANAASMTEAIKLAVRLAKNERNG